MDPITVVGSKMALPQDKWVGLVSHALLVGVAAALTWASQNIGNEDFGPWTPAVVAVVSLVLNYITKVINNPTEPVVPIPPIPPTPPEPIIPTPKPDNNTTDEQDFPIG